MLRQGEPYAIGSRLFEILLEELRFHRVSHRYLSEKEFKVLCRYYSSWLKDQSQFYYKHYFAQRLKELIKCIVTSKQTRVLDCGCGPGSESILCALLGAQVSAIDLNKERINIAKKRLRYYEDKFCKELPVTFDIKNILECQFDQQFDVAYAQEFISHVHPLTTFLQTVRKSIKKGGVLIVSDANPINLYQNLKAWLTYQKAHFKVYELGPSDKVLVARERLVTPYHLKKLLERFGFKTELINYHGFLPNIPVRCNIDFLRTWESRKNPLHVFGAIYDIVAVKL